jgi:hypothetical protein
MLLRCASESMSLINYLFPPFLTNLYALSYNKYLSRIQWSAKIIYSYWLCFAQNELKREHP